MLSNMIVITKSTQTTRICGIIASNLDQEIIDRYEGLITSLKMKKISPLTVMSNIPEWFRMRRFSFASSSMHRIYSTLFTMKISYLEAIKLKKNHLEFTFNFIKSFNKFEKFDGNNSENAFFVGTLKYENDYLPNKRNRLSNHVL